MSQIKPIRLTKERRVVSSELTETNREKGDVACTFRPRGEMTDERKVRKAAVKEERRVRTPLRTVIHTARRLTGVDFRDLCEHFCSREIQIKKNYS